MNVLMNVDRKAAIEAGNEYFGEQVVDLPLDRLNDEQRAMLVRIPTRTAPIPGVSGKIPNLEGYGDNTLGSSMTMAIARPADEKTLSLRTPGEPEAPCPAQATPEAAIEMIDFWIKKLRAIEDYTTNALDRVEQQLQSVDPGEAVVKDRVLEERLIHPAEKAVGVVLNSVARTQVLRTSTGKSLVRQAMDIQRQRIEEEKAAREERERLKTEKREAARRALEQWAEQSGSERLRLAKETGEGDFELLAREEFITQHAPTGFTKGTVSADRRKRPTVDELRAFKWLKQLVEASDGTLDDASLDYEEGDGEEDYRVVLEVKVVAPDGHTAWFHADYRDVLDRIEGCAPEPA